VATHPDQALALLAAPTADERRILGAFSYSLNEAVLHTDELLLPRRRIARAAWNYHLPACEPAAAPATLTYSMNRLQRLDAREEWCVTLNRGAAIREDRVVRRILYEHPRFTVETLAAQAELGSLNGPNRTAFCGAYAGYGFHEDGLVSGLAAARATLEAAT
jgi:predicted NAD/FAD-binding protein